MRSPSRPSLDLTPRFSSISCDLTVHTSYTHCRQFSSELLDQRVYQGIEAPSHLFSTMRLLQLNSTGEVSLLKDFIGDNVRQYAILSHTWGADGEEVTFKDLVDGTGKSKTGYNKIRFRGEQAKRDGVQYFWVDTCCIDKSSSAELQEAINSMFRLYRDATKCYVYLSDVTSATFGADEISDQPWEVDFRKSRCFARGWTLQELIAPSSVEFFSKEWVELGNRSSLERHIHEVTGIPVKALRGHNLFDFSVHERMIWAENRNTTRQEDKAYPLLGIFNVHMPLIYGEGREGAFRRLREEIEKASKGKLSLHITNILYARCFQIASC
jgi:hypothetical protein